MGVRGDPDARPACWFAEAEPSRFLDSVGRSAAFCWLDASEQERAGRFFREEHRELFIGAHAFWRWSLGRFLGCDPADLKFELGQHGKPRLIEPGGSALETNLSHTRGRVAVAIARGGPVGIDVEAIDRRLEPSELGPRVFAPEELSWMLDPADRGQQRERFFRLWTLKESYAKALGIGFGIDFAAHRFRPTAQGGWKLDRAPDPAALDVPWTFYELSLGSGHHLSVCMRGAAVPVERLA